MRRVAVGLLWLSLLLLPVRGWAWATMQLGAFDGAGSASATAATPVLHEAMAAHCHAAAVSSSADVGNADGGQPSTHPCASCDLCHGAALPASPQAARTGFSPPRVAWAQPQRDSFAAAVARPPPRT